MQLDREEEIMHVEIEMGLGAVDKIVVVWALREADSLAVSGSSILPTPAA